MYRARLDAMGVEIRPPRPRIEGEGESLYFHDFDNHLFELHAGTLTARLQAYRAALTPTPLPKGEEIDQASVALSAPEGFDPASAAP